MSHKRLTTWQKATALVPLALLSGAWTTSLAVTSSATATTNDTTTLPDGTIVPNQALDAPASMSRPGSVAPGVPAGASGSVIANASTNGIPAAALAAYQRGEQVINAADANCNLSWQLIAAIGRVESDHGRFGGNVLGEDGKSRPGIFGIPLDGSDGTAEIRDSDGGTYDNDPIYDRAVGPMQFIPQTWSVVGVDADGDGARDPQDIDDAALASAVYLCSGDEDLSTYGGQKAAVYRYNHSQEYVDLVISIMNAYLEGDYSPAPNGVAGSTVFAPSIDGAAVAPAGIGSKKAATRDGAKTRNAGSGGSGGSGGGSTSPVDGGSDPSDEVPEEQPGDEPTEDTTEVVKKTVESTKEAAKPVTEPVDEATGGALTKAEATEKCLASGISPLDVAGLAACVEDRMS
ncbi:MAG TPA: lytic transglycosylase domain-containing protein [Nocardioidaceae bacterium]|nr:lytic transglycosylase domain-containing protein [Nocardioidaceae bacterium]